MLLFCGVQSDLPLATLALPRLVGGLLPALALLLRGCLFPGFLARSYAWQPWYLPRGRVDFFRLAAGLRADFRRIPSAAELTA